MSDLTGLRADARKTRVNKKSSKTSPSPGTYFEEASKYLPHILTLIDQSPISPTYGCFDRNYWHYKTADFPSGMYQENVLPLALVYKIEFPGNVYCNNSSIKKLAIAGMRFAMNSSHRDGSCDDYYPNERALGATVFSLVAMTEAYQVLELKEKEIESFFIKRAEWLLNHQESGKLTNHQALVVLALYNVFAISGQRKFLEGAKKRLELVTEWQHPEGWFQEYEGADPGYQTVTIDALARYWLKSGDSSVLPVLEKALKFCVYFFHPDSSFGGEYGSRNTFIAYPAGMEILSGQFPEASYLATGFLEGIRTGKRLFLDDDRMVGHLVSNYLLAYCLFQENKVSPYRHPEEFFRYFPGCKIAVIKKPPFYAIVSLNKGGTHKIFKGKDLKSNSTGYAVELEDKRIGVTNIIASSRATVKDRRIFIRGQFGLYRKEYATPFKVILFRILTLFCGQSVAGSQWIRKLLQKRLITHKQFLPVYFESTFDFAGKCIKITDKIWKCNNIEAARLMRTTNLTSIYVAQSNAHQAGRLSKWENLEREKNKLNSENRVNCVRIIE